jgi:hypothetical protein
MPWYGPSLLLALLMVLVFLGLLSTPILHYLALREIRKIVVALPEHRREAALAEAMKGFAKSIERDAEDSGRAEDCS